MERLLSAQAASQPKQKAAEPRLPGQHGFHRTGATPPTEALPGLSARLPLKGSFCARLHRPSAKFPLLRLPTNLPDPVVGKTASANFKGTQRRQEASVPRDAIPTGKGHKQGL